MSRLKTTFRQAAFIALLAAVLITGWWLAGDEDAGSGVTAAEAVLRTKGPQDAAFCGPLAQPRPPPPVDSPFGVHLFATTPLGVVHPVRGSMEIANDLGLPGAVADKVPHQPANETAFDDVQSVSMLLEEFRRAFGAMPTGELNDEIVRRLQGENPKGIAVLPKSHPAINGEGELMDRWGTPYRFHPESVWETTVRSAGPDKKMWTRDDILSERVNADVVLK